MTKVAHPVWLIGACLTTVVLMLAGCQQSPLVETQAAEDALDRARIAGAPEYAPETFKAAEETLQKAREELSVQDNAFALMRDYDTARSLLTKAEEGAETAVRQANETKESAKSSATTAITQARTKVDAARILLAKAPSGKGTRADLQAMQGDLTAAETMVTESQSALEQQDFRGAAAKAQSAESLASQVNEQVMRAIEKTQSRKR